MRNVLLTGASGAIGTDIAAALAQAGIGVTVLLHRNSELVRSGGETVALSGTAPPLPEPGEIRAISGDVTKPQLGLADHAFCEIATSTDLIIHSAAVTDFGKPQHLYDEVNVLGTKHVLELVSAGSPNPLGLLHISTVMVCGERDGLIREDDLDVGQAFANPYEQTKNEAEQLILAARQSGVPAAIVRPSIVVGAEQSGQVRDFQNIYVVLKILTEGNVSSVPGQYGALLDLVPVDYVADVICEIATRFGEAAGKTFHLVNGTPLTIRDISDVLAEYPMFRAPRFVPPQNFDVDALPPIERRYYERIMSLYDPYFRRRVTFDNTNTVAFAKRRPPNSAADFFRTVLDYCLRVGYLGSALPRPADVAKRLSQEPSGTAAVSSPQPEGTRT
jgi:thioester reductase-like protein